MGLLRALFGRAKTPDDPSSWGKRETVQPEREEAGETVLKVGNIQEQGERERQEDSFAVLNSADPERFLRQGLLAVVADGMGGMADGKMASQCAVNELLSRFSGWEGEPSVPDWFYSGAYAVNDRVFEAFSGQSGTTLTAVHIFGDRLHWLSVGDSAIYLMRGGGVYQLNREHNYLNRLYAKELEEETIDKNRAEFDPDARRLTSFVGIDCLREVDFNLRPLILKRGDAVLLCSDGISGILTPPELAEAMSLEPCQGCALLETLVREKHIPEQDNYTGVLISYR